MSALLETADAVVAIAVDMCNGMEDNAQNDADIVSLNGAITRYQLAAGPYRDAPAEPRPLPDDLLDLAPSSMPEARAWLRELVGLLVASRAEVHDARGGGQGLELFRLRQVLGAVHLLTEEQS